MIFVPSLERLASVEGDDFTELLAIRREWSEIFAEDFVHFDSFYALIIDAGQTLLGVEQSRAHAHVFTRKAAEVFLCTASDTGYLRAIGSKPAIETRLARHNETILSLIAQMTAAAKGDKSLACRWVHSFRSIFIILRQVMLRGPSRRCDARHSRCLDGLSRAIILVCNLPFGAGC